MSIKGIKIGADSIVGINDMIDKSNDKISRIIPPPKLIHGFVFAYKWKLDQRREYF